MTPEELADRYRKHAEFMVESGQFTGTVDEYLANNRMTGDLEEIFRRRLAAADTDQPAAPIDRTGRMLEESARAVAAERGIPIDQARALARAAYDDLLNRQTAGNWQAGESRRTARRKAEKLNRPRRRR